MLEAILEWDRETFIYLNNLGIEEYDGFWSFITNITTWIPLYIAFFVLIFYKYPKKHAVSVTLTVLLLVIVILSATEITKEFVARLRPNNEPEVNTLIRILKSPTNFSFWSGHAASSFGITTFIVLVLRKYFKWAYLFYIWPLLFASSRIYVGVHYPVDIIVGTIVGISLAFLFYYLLRRFIEPYILKARPEPAK